MPECATKAASLRLPPTTGANGLPGPTTSPGSSLPPPPSNDKNAIEASGISEENAVDAEGNLREKGKKGFLDEIGELWDEKQYEDEFDLEGFLGRMKS